MAYRRVPFGLHEWYHCYSRGVDKRITFESEQDYRRFEQLLYLSNNEALSQRASFANDIRHEKIFTIPRGSPLVSIGAYVLMPNHFHLIMQEVVEGGITKFMHKVGTAYTMYFNIKNERVGNLFVKPFRSKHIADDRYLKYVVQYVHLNSAELFEPKWKEGKVADMKLLQKQLRSYEHGSLQDYINPPRAMGSILNLEACLLLREDLPPFTTIMQDAAEYYSGLKW